MRSVLVVLWLVAFGHGLGFAQCYFTPANELVPSELGCRFASGDVDSDGDIDFLVFGAGGTVCWRRVGRGGRGWTLDSVRLIPEPFTWPTAGALGDLDGNGTLDLVVSTDEDTLVFYVSRRADSLLCWERVAFGIEEIQLPSGSLQPHIGDLDADGDLDIAFVERNGHLGCLRRSGTSRLPSWDYVGLLFGVEMGKWDTATGALCDLDGDGDADLVSANVNGPLVAWENISTADEFDFGLQPHLLQMVDGVVGGVCGLSLSDFDGDTNPDLVVVDTLGMCRGYRSDAPCLRHLLELEPVGVQTGEPPN